MDLQRIESELHKRIAYPYHWGRKQSNVWDAETRFIYKTYSFRALLEKTQHLSQELRDYAFNRWYNYWSAMAVEAIFVSHPEVQANQNVYDKLVDFKINDLPFDHKTTIFPKGFKPTFEYAQQHKRELIQWLYDNQSHEGRQHFGNRLFIVLYDDVLFDHWKMKAEISCLKASVDNYVETFREDNLMNFDFGSGNVLSDIIWVKRSEFS